MLQQRNLQAKQKKGQKSSIDDMLGDLLGDDDFPVKAKVPAREAGRLGPPLPSRSGKRSLLGDDDFFSKLAEEAEKDEGSDVSEADPTALLESMKDIDDMDADLFRSKKKPSSAPAQSKGSGIGGPTKNPPKSGNKLKGGEISDELHIEEKKPSSAPASTARGYQRFSFTDDDDVLAPTTDTKDFDDPLADLLDDLPIENKNEPKITKKAPTEKSVLPPDSPIIKKKETASPAPVAKKRDELMFDDDEDDLMDALGFGESPKESPKKNETVLIPKNESSSEPPQRARTRLDEILGRGTSPRLLERPPTGERKDPPQQQQEKQKHHQETPTTKDPFLEEDLTFGSYQPTLVTTPEGRHSRRQSVRFSTEDNSASSPEKKPKPITPTTLTPTFPRPAADWLGLSQDDDEQEEEPPPVPEPLKTPSSSVGSKPSSSGNRIPQPSTETPNTSFKSPKPVGPSVEVSGSQKDEEDWLSGALSRKKTQSSTQSEEKRTTQEDFLGFGDEVDLESFLSKRGSSPASRRKDASTPNKEPGDSPLPREPSHRQPSPTAHSTPVREDQFRPAVSARVGFYPDQTPDPSPLPTSATISFPLPQQYHPPALQDHTEPGWPSQAELSCNYPAQPWQSMSGPMPHAMMPGSMRLPQQSQMQNTAPVVQPQVSLSANSLQQLLLQQQQLESQLLGLGGAADVAGLQRQKRETEKQNGHLALQARIIKLEGQVRSLQQELDQNQMLLESVQQRHKQDTELMENTHRARVKLLDDSAAQREARARQECEDLAERLATVTRIAEQERMELQAKHQRRLAQTQQDRDREVERLRDLQRKSILEMKKDHEDQVQRLKRLKDEEIDAVTSATSQTRLGDLSSRVESTHENTAQGLEQGARQRDEQLRVMQDRLGQQQRAMAEERTRLKEVIAKMDTQLAEQQRQLEKVRSHSEERWRVNAEQAKADSSQRGLDEERRSLTQHISMEREELERAKSALLEEQQQVMQRCAEERRKLAAEWTQFHTQEKQRQDRAEREASRALERDAHREGSIISMAQEQVDLKLRAGELKQHEAAVAREREALERQREELDKEKERLSGTGLQLKTRAQEVEAFSKLASEKYIEGEKALQESRHVETEHQTRLRSIHSQMERLRQQEQHLHQVNKWGVYQPISHHTSGMVPERRKMTEQLREMERLKHSLPITPFPQSMDPIFTEFRPVLAVPQMASTKAVRQPSPQFSSPDSTELQARLALLRHTAEKDRDFLQDEQFFLDALKKAPYNSAFHTD
ncbi:fas-binding factor 1 homolog isoform X8 [Salvelinus fontinalis]|uniref:fas-binding factor 1 homolog isoform X8 n=1 Tax=Salvelinus fontinalis TaxID=8038 RepID=UPI0024860D64|nr:fas-binding factor 1 homolog isoform X8 [Salvelinus fontinalis]